MQTADFQLQQMKNWNLLRAYFQSGDVVCNVMTPLAISIFPEKPHFRWIGLIHRDGNVLATDQAITDKFKAIKQVMYYIHKAAEDIEQAR